MTFPSISMRIGRALAWAAAVASGMAGVSSVAQPMEPASADWQIHQDAESCRAVRVFGTGEDRVFLSIRTFGPGSAVALTVASPTLPKDPSTPREVLVSWDTDQQEMRRVGLLGMAGTLPTLTVQLASRPVTAFYKGLAEHWVAYVSSVDPTAQTIRLQIPGAPPLTLRMESLQVPLAQLAQCENAQLDKWGFGKDYAARIASGPELLDPDSLEDLLYYPKTALMNHVGGLLQLRLKVDAEGKIAECTAQESPGRSFAADSCTSLRRHARFTPARDRDGRAVEGFAQLSITFARFD